MIIKSARIDENKFLNGIGLAEHRKASTPAEAFIRTQYAPAQGSTAYGPFQFTGTLISGFAKNSRYAPVHRYINNTMIPAYGNMSSWGKDPAIPANLKHYDYGGNASLNAPDLQQSYMTLARLYSAEMADLAEQRFPGNDAEQLKWAVTAHRFGRNWKGDITDESQGDPTYWNLASGVYNGTVQPKVDYIKAFPEVFSASAPSQVSAPHIPRYPNIRQQQSGNIPMQGRLKWVDYRKLSGITGDTAPSSTPQNTPVENNLNRPPLKGGLLGTKNNPNIPRQPVVVKPPPPTPQQLKAIQRNSARKVRGYDMI